jgi:hypothetical protein
MRGLFANFDTRTQNTSNDTTENLTPQLQEAGMYIENRGMGFKAHQRMVGVINDLAGNSTEFIARDQHDL